MQLNVNEGNSVFRIKTECPFFTEMKPTIYIKMSDEIKDIKENIIQPAETPVAASHYVRLRGLPFSAKVDDIRNFFEDIPVNDVKMTNTRDGRPSGECYCALKTAEDADRAVMVLNRKEMNNRYIEVFPVTEGEAEGLNKPGSIVAEIEDRVIRLRGLPFSANKDDIESFLAGLTCDEVVIGQTGGRPSGEAYVRLATKEQAAQALELNRKTMGSRYIEIFRTNENDLERHRDRLRSGHNGPERYANKPPSLMSFDYSNNENANGYGRNDFGRYDNNDGYGGPVYPVRTPRNRPNPYEQPRRSSGPQRPSGYDDYNRGSGGSTDSEAFRNANNVFMRGIPFDVSPGEIERFFAPLPCIEIKIGYNRENRPSGDGVVTFSNPHDVAMAFEKNKQYLGRRYVELFSGREAPPPMRSLVWKRIAGGGPAQSQGNYSYPDQGYAASYAAYDYKGYNASYGDSDTYGRSAPYGSYEYGNSAPPSQGYAGSYDGYYGSGQDYRGSYSNGGQYGAIGTRPPPPAAPAPPPPPPPPSRGSYSGPAYPGRY